MKRLVAEEGKPLANPDREGFHHVGHSTHWIVLGGTRILTDPWVEEPAYATLSHRPLPSPLPTGPDLVLITHSHSDHFDPAALERLERHAAVVVPTNKIRGQVQAMGFAQAVLAVPGSRLELCGLTIDVVIGKHDVYEVCYRVERDGFAFFFGGDTMLTPQIRQMANRQPVRFAILPGERSSLFGKQFVMTPEEAVSLAQEFGADRAILTHHESYVSRRWPLGWMIRVPPPAPEDYPSWFLVPRPGDYVPFPWESSL